MLKSVSQQNLGDLVIRSCMCVSVFVRVCVWPCLIFWFWIRWLHTWRFLWTLLTSAFMHGLPPCPSLSFSLSLALFLASNIKAILVVSRCLLTSFRYRQPSNKHRKTPIPHTRSSISSLLHLRFLFFCPRFLSPLLYSSTLTPVPSACDAISPLNPALHIPQVFFFPSFPSGFICGFPRGDG